MSIRKTSFLVRSLCFAFAVAAPITVVNADPLPGEVLKFQQLPLSNTPITNTTGTTGFYNGRDELSTAYLNAASQTYTGGFFADDFSDLVSTPVVHVKWWGSYIGTVGTPTNTAQQFLIAFESDVPAVPPQNGVPGTPSQPGSVLQYEVVTAGALTPASGTFTETLDQSVPGGENLYRYNAELAVPFAEQANTVYWLKIVALDSSGQVPGLISWGWHNRDYTVTDPFASNVPTPGEFDESGGSFVTPVWHFQDDAVRGGITMTPLSAPGQYSIVQNSFTPSLYIDGPDGPTGIGNYSEDLAFELYTTGNVPEPSSVALLAIGSLLVIRRQRANQSK